MYGTRIQLTQEQVIARRNFLKWGIIGGLVVAPIGLSVYRCTSQRKSFTFGIHQRPNDLHWKRCEYPSAEFCPRLPKSLSFFYPESLHVLGNSATLYFSTLGGKDYGELFSLSGRARLRDKSSIEGPIFIGENQNNEPPKLSPFPVGMVYPKILIQQMSYDILFSSGFDFSNVVQIVWTLELV